jgi:NTE family protein
LELAEGNNNGMNYNFPLVEEEMSQQLSSSEYQRPIASTTDIDHSAITHISQIKSTKSFYSSAIYGNKKVFMPRWRPEYVFTDPQYFTPYNWTYLYDHSPLIKTLEMYVDFNKLQPNGNPNSRL